MNSSWLDLYSEVFKALLLLLPIVAPVLLLWLLIRLWIDYARKQFLSTQEYQLLKITPPEKIEKSPLAMELFLTSLHQVGGEATWYDKYVKGKVRSWFSLEIVSLSGRVSFYIWLKKDLVKYIESQLYAQYPNVEIQRIEDYMQNFSFDTDKYSFWGAELELTQPDPYPIKTYVDYGLDQNLEEYQKTDPLAQQIEFLGSLEQGHNIGLQILVRAHVKEDKKAGKLFEKTDKWKDDAKEEIKKIREEVAFKKDDNVVTQQTEGQKFKIAALERSVSKHGFDVGIRTFYFADKDVFAPVNIGGMLGGFKNYSSGDLNGFKPNFVTDFKFPWQDFTGNRKIARKREIFNAYVERAYFWRTLEGKKRKHFVLNSEELATIFHFPGQADTTPTFSISSAKKASPPANLPI